MKEIFISTGGIKGHTKDFIDKLRTDGMNRFELSGTKLDASFLKYISDALKAGCEFRLHNFFEIDRKVFILNLGSLDNDVSEMSKKHILKALELSNQFGAHYYAIHAPFLIDPKLQNLGKGFPPGILYDRTKVLDKFKDSINSLSTVARNYGVELAVENNVLSYKDMVTFGDHQPFTFLGDTISDDINGISSDVGLRC